MNRLPHLPNHICYSTHTFLNLNEELWMCVQGVNVREDVHLLHRCDSIQGTDYIANYFLNLRVSRTKI